MIDKDKKSADIKELRKFGLVVGGVFILVFGLLLPLIFHRPFRIWPWVVGGPLFFFGLIFPPALKVPYKAWMSLAMVLNWINTRIILGILFYGLFTPISFVLRLLRRDPLARSFEGAPVSYRIPTQERSHNQMERPF